MFEWWWVVVLEHIWLRFESTFLATLFFALSLTHLSPKYSKPLKHSGGRRRVIKLIQMERMSDAVCLFVHYYAMTL